MEHPVLCSDGHMYDKEAIEAWFAGGHRNSPLEEEHVLDQSLKVTVKKLHTLRRDYAKTLTSSAEQAKARKDAIMGLQQKIPSRDLDWKMGPCLNQILDVKDKFGNWAEARIVRVDQANNGTYVRVRFLGFSERYEEIHPFIMSWNPTVASWRAHTKPRPQPPEWKINLLEIGGATTDSEKKLIDFDVGGYCDMWKLASVGAIDEGRHMAMVTPLDPIYGSHSMWINLESDRMTLPHKHLPVCHNLGMACSLLADEKHMASFAHTCARGDSCSLQREAVHAKHFMHPSPQFTGRIGT